MTDTTTAARPERRKYDLIADSKITAFGVDLFRVRALISFGDVAAGDLGGYVQSEKSLDQDGDAWVSGNAWVFGNAQVFGNAWVFGNAQVFGNAWVFGNAQVSGDAQVYGNAQVFGNAWVFGDAQVYGNAQVYGDARVFGNAQVYGDARVFGDAQVYGDAIMQIGPIGSRSATLTATLSAGGSVQVVTGCFLGSLDEFRTAVETTHGDSQHGRDYRAAITLIESRAASWSLPEAVFAAVPIKGEQA